ncbi:MAG: ABC transporter permease [Bacteroidales bacterium]|nr:ABC transporter permease [Bacteroidales bacterium]
MTHTFFIASRLRYKRRIVTISIAISYIIMIVAVAVSSGFRSEVRDALSQMGGDIQLCPSNLNFLDEAQPVNSNPSYLSQLRELKQVESVHPAVYRAGIMKVGENIHGVLIKGVQTDDTTALTVSIPRRLAKVSGLSEGDKVLTYFVGEKVKARNFRVTSIYDPVVETDDNLIVYADIADLRRLNGWGDDDASMLEVNLKPQYRDKQQIEATTQEVGFIAYAGADEDDTNVFASSVSSRYPQLFDWLDLLDFNVLFVLVLMMIVAGFNMISGLLITLFENISTIGVFKAMGMTDKAISKIFLSSSATLVLKGMAIGNAVALLFCFIQGTFHLLKLNPTNYFVSFVPVNLNLLSVLTVDCISFVIIMLLLLIPCAFISKVDPADTVRVR